MFPFCEQQLRMQTSNLFSPLDWYKKRQTNTVSVAIKQKSLPAFHVTVSNKSSDRVGMNFYISDFSLLTVNGRLTGADLWSDGRELGRNSLQVKVERLPGEWSLSSICFTPDRKIISWQSNTEVNTGNFSRLYLTHLVNVRRLGHLLAAEAFGTLCQLFASFQN